MVSWYILYGIIFGILIILMMMVPWIIGDINRIQEHEIGVCEMEMDNGEAEGKEEGKMEGNENKVDKMIRIEEGKEEEIRWKGGEEEKEIKEDEREIKEVIETRKEIVRRGRRRGFRVKNVFK